MEMPRTPHRTGQQKLEEILFGPASAGSEEAAEAGDEEAECGIDMIPHAPLFLSLRLSDAAGRTMSYSFRSWIIWIYFGRMVYHLDHSPSFG